MAHIYWELHEIPQPEGSYVNRSDGRVFLMSDDGNGKSKRRVIGHATSDTMMHPNELYRFLYPTEWELQYHEKSFPAHELHMGMYMLSLGIGYSTELYKILHEIYGPLYANAIMDYAMYSIMDRNDTTQLFTDRMSREVLFSKEAYSDTWYSDLFKRHMSEDANHQFRLLWLKRCQQRGITKVWLSIDGSNNDCSISDGDLAEKGNAKSHRNTNIVSYIWAVDASSGKPVTYQVNNGGMVDSKAFQKIVTVLKGAGISVEGIILDRGFCTHDVLTAIKESGYAYILMLKSDTYGHTKMLEEHSEDIRWKVSNVVSEDGIFGIRSKGKVFGSHSDEAFLYLYYDGVNGSGRSVTLIRKVIRGAEQMRKAIASGEKPAVPKGLGSYLELRKEGSSQVVHYKYEAWQKAVDEKGFCSIASSEELDPARIHELYHLRDASEKQFMILKSQLGFDVTRVHSIDSLMGKFAVCFVAAVLRSEIMTACHELELDTNRMLREIDRISLVLLPDGTYSEINNLSIRQTQLLEFFKVPTNKLDAFAVDINRRLINPINSQMHKMPEASVSFVKKHRGRPPKQKDASEQEKVKRKPGRPKGSKNKKTLEREANAINIPKRKPGRPRGSKNRKTLEREALVAQQAKRKPGRPKGSKNKPKK